jgi:hypothetical protein
MLGFAWIARLGNRSLLRNIHSRTTSFRTVNSTYRTHSRRILKSFQLFPEKRTNRGLDCEIPKWCAFSEEDRIGLDRIGQSFFHD